MPPTKTLRGCEYCSLVRSPRRTLAPASATMPFSVSLRIHAATSVSFCGMARPYMSTKTLRPRLAFSPYGWSSWGRSAGPTVWSALRCCSTAQTSRSCFAARGSAALALASSQGKSVQKCSLGRWPSSSGCSRSTTSSSRPMRKLMPEMSSYMSRTGLSSSIASGRSFSGIAPASDGGSTAIAARDDGSGRQASRGVDASASPLLPPPSSMNSRSASSSKPAVGASGKG
mmetsp:Transcript_37602/g.117550  ORF Transcript_37602/g.117550 Transcript_37602/m.117550 type:complete len:229 (-) Transcript_37602:546-1232(-)